MKESLNDQKIAKAINTSIRSTTRKLNDVANLIRRQTVSSALNQLQFCRKKVAVDVKKCLLSAIANAENNYNLDVDRLYVERVYVGKAFVLKRFMPRARGRASRILKEFSNLTIIVKESGDN